jgi:hypothetical protein
LSVKKPSSHGKLIKVALAVNYTKDTAWLSHNNAIHQARLLKFSGFNPFHCGLVMAAFDRQLPTVLLSGKFVLAHLRSWLQ